VGQPAEAPLHHPATREHDEAPCGRVTGHHPVAHAVQVRPGAAALGREGTVVDTLAQRRPADLAGVQRLQRVPVLHGSRHDGDREPVPLGVDQRHPLAPDRTLGRVVPPRAAHGDALHRLRVDDAQARPRSSANLAPATARCLPQQGVEQTQVEPAPKPAVDGPPGREALRQGTPGPAHPQVPRNRADHAPGRGCAPAPRRVNLPQPARDLVRRAARYQLLQTRLVPRPMRLRPHLPVTPRLHIRVAHLEPRRSDGDGTPNRTQTGSQSFT